MIDTIHLTLDDFEIKDNADITIQPAPINYKTGEKNERVLFRDSSGREVLGYKAYLNDDVFNFTISPDNLTGGVYRKLQFSPPKVVNGTNYHTLSDSEILESFKVLQDRLDDSGIRLNLGACRVSRLDACRNAYTDYAFPFYAPLLRNITMSRKQRKYYGTTFLWENKSNEVCIYDKNKEMSERGFSLKGLPENAIRFEYRLLKGRSADRALNGKETLYLRDIKDTAEIRDAYDKTMRKEIFKDSLKDVSGRGGNNSEIRHGYADDVSTGRWNESLISDRGAYEMLQDETIEAIELDYLSIYADKKHAKKAVKVLEERARRYQKYLKNNEGVSYADLYQELESKVLAKD